MSAGTDVHAAMIDLTERARAAADGADAMRRGTSAHVAALVRAGETVEVLVPAGDWGETSRVARVTEVAERPGRPAYLHLEGGGFLIDRDSDPVRYRVVLDTADVAALLRGIADDLHELLGRVEEAATRAETRAT